MHLGILFGLFSLFSNKKLMCDEGEWVQKSPTGKAGTGQHTNVYPSQLRCLRISLVKVVVSCCSLLLRQEDVQTAN